MTMADSTRADRVREGRVRRVMAAVAVPQGVSTLVPWAAASATVPAGGGRAACNLRNMIDY